MLDLLEKGLELIIGAFIRVILSTLFVFLLALCLPNLLIRPVVERSAAWLVESYRRLDG